MMHPSRQAYVEEDEPEVSSSLPGKRPLEMFMNQFRAAVARCQGLCLRFVSRIRADGTSSVVGC